MNEVLIDMANTNALITIAMLAAIHEGHNKDYLDIIQPFVCTLLPIKGKQIDFLDIKSHMEKEFGFVNIPVGVLQKIATRLSYLTPPLCTCYGHNSFVMNESYDNSEFRTKRENIKIACSAVAEALRDYLVNERAMKVDLERCISEILHFLDQCGHHILKNNEGIRSLPIDERIGRYIASFIQQEKDKHSSTYDRILELARGYMVYRCIYFFSKSGIEKGNMSLKDVVVYLDTPLIINVLGYDTEIRKQAVWDAIKLAKDLGARVSVLEHNVEEVQGILNAYITAYPRVQTFDLEFLKIQAYSEVTIRSISESIPKTLSSVLGETIDVAPGLGSSSDWDQINTEEALRRYYLESIQGKENEEIRRSRIENDVRTLSYALKIRDGNRPNRFENCKVLVLSESKTARNAARALYDDARQEEVNLVYSLNDFSCLAWLSSPSPASNIEENLLLYNAAAVLDPSDSIINQMLKYVDELAEVGAIDEDMAYVLRAHPSVKEAASEFIDSKAPTFSPDTIRNIYEKAVSNRVNEVASAIYEPQVKDLQEQLQHSNMLKNTAETELRKEKQKENDRLVRLDMESRAKADKISQRVGKVFIAIIRIMQICIILSCMYSVYDGIRTNFSSDTSISAWEYIAAFLSLISTIDFFVPKMHFGSKWSKKLTNAVDDIIYAREMKIGKKYLNM